MYGDPVISPSKKEGLRVFLHNWDRSWMSRGFESSSRADNERHTGCACCDGSILAKDGGMIIIPLPEPTSGDLASSFAVSLTVELAICGCDDA
jgi:hypothetical protein